MNLVQQLLHKEATATEMARAQTEHMTPQFNKYFSNSFAKTDNCISSFQFPCGHREAGDGSPS